MSAPEGILFDVDGTLVDTRSLHVESWVYAFDTFGYPLPASSFQETFGKTSDEIARLLLPEGSFDETAKSLIEAKKKWFRAHLPDVVIFPGVKELFSYLKKRGIKVGLASSANKDELDYYIDNLIGRELIDDVISGESLTTSKPDPEIFLKLDSEMAIPKESTVIVGDSPYDIEAAARSRIAAFAVTTGGFKPERLKLAGAAKVFKDIKDIYEHVPDSLEL